MMGLNPGKGQSKEAAKTKNGLSLERYAEPPSKQVRRVPLGIALIIDQEHLDRLLYVFSKSPLRILTTQVIINRYPGSLRPSGFSQPDAPRSGGNAHVPGSRPQPGYVGSAQSNGGDTPAAAAATARKPTWKSSSTGLLRCTSATRRAGQQIAARINHDGKLIRRKRRPEFTFGGRPWRKNRAST